MIDETKLAQLERMFNTTPCPLCGGRHSVRLSPKCDHSSASSSMVALGEDVIFVEATGGCEGFSSSVRNFIVKNRGRLIKDPFDHIM